MKANEFQIGDWVQWNFDVEPKHRQIFSIITEEDSDGNKQYYADLGDGEIYKDLIPIPLTPEILEKNGFKQADAFRKGYGYDFPSQYNEDMYPIYLLTNGIWNIQCAELIDIKHVHELQHALRLCGLNDLADNFKI